LACFAIGAILILVGLTENARPRWRRAVFDIVEKIYRALGIHQTWLFVLVVALVCGCLATLGGGAVAWVVARAYKNSAEYRAEHPDQKPQPGSHSDTPSAPIASQNPGQKSHKVVPHESPAMPTKDAVQAWDDFGNVVHIGEGGSISDNGTGIKADTPVHIIVNGKAAITRNKVGIDLRAPKPADCSAKGTDKNENGQEECQAKQPKDNK
jgi:hypothetical protein